MAEHKLERRVRMLSDAITEKTKALATSITPEGASPPFTERMNRPQALAWWAQHRYDAYGKAVIERLSPMAIMNLDVALSQYIESQQPTENPDAV